MSSYYNKAGNPDGGAEVAETGLVQTQLAVTDRTALGRLPDRGSHERALVNAILDEGYVAHVGLGTERGPVVLPMAYGRDGEVLYLHGSVGSRFFRHVRHGVPLCVTVTLVDALVLARSAFHHSMNYRSVVVFGTAVEVEDLDERAVALERLVEHIVPGRVADARPANGKELRATMVLRLPITEASAKVRTGPPIDDDDDLELAVWAGVIPIGPVPGVPAADDHVLAGTPVPSYATNYRRPGGGELQQARSLGQLTAVRGGSGDGEESRADPRQDRGRA